jgi:DNA-binding NarL/FixJ family response regulator
MPSGRWRRLPVQQCWWIARYRSRSCSHWQASLRFTRAGVRWGRYCRHRRQSMCRCCSAWVVRALLSSEASLEEFLFGLSALLSGQDFVSPPFAEHLRRSMEREHAPHRQLSAREWQVFALLVQGWGNTAIARRLNVAPKTVGEYRRRIARKLGCTTVAELVHYAVAHGLVKPSGSLPQALSEEA